MPRTHHGGLTTAMNLRSLLLNLLMPVAACAQLALTPSTTEGPYYPFNSTQPLSTAAPAGAFTQAAAFMLARGSRDAAVLVTLAAGASYTALVSGVDGATGEALVEIYDLP
jgi:hypothetical protein